MYTLANGLIAELSPSEQISKLKSWIVPLLYASTNPQQPK